MSSDRNLGIRTVRALCAAWLALLIGLAGPSVADEPAPEASSDVPVPEKAPPDEGHGSPESANAAPGSHVHDVQPAPAKSVSESLKDIWTRDKLSGDWRGLRKDLLDHGVDIELRLSQFGQWVASGGVDENGEYGGLMDYRVNVDAHKLLGLWKGLGFSLHAQTRWGEDILADAGGILLPNTPLLYPLPGDYSDSDITGLLVQQSLLDGRAALLAGKVNVVDLWTMMYPHVGYGQEGFWNVNALAAGWPWLRHVNLSIWGAGGMLVAKEGIQGAIVAYGQENVATSWDFKDSFDDGVGLLGVWRFFWDIDEKPGSVLFAGGGATKKYPSLDPTDWSFIPGEGLVNDEQGKPWTAAVYLYQEFWHGAGDEGRKAYLYTAASFADKNPSFVRWNVMTTVEALGPLPIRKADRMGVAGWYNRVNKDVRDLVSTVGLRLRDGSWGVELYYNAEINRWLHLTGDLQIAQNENKSDDVAVIPGVRLVIDF